MIETPCITHSAEKTAAVIHFDIPRSEMMQVFGPAVQELLAALATQGIKPDGSVFAHHLEMTPERFDFELGFFVDQHVAAVGRVKPGALRAAKVARTVYQGGYQGLPDAWGELMTWIEAGGHTPAADLWEWYLVGPNLSPNPADWRTELNRPVLD
jgi:effector-binding domain-containing protein